METCKVVFSVNEVFGPTIQGEGALAGAPTFFVRFNGCDYRCSWCDSLDAVLPERIKLHTTKMNQFEILDKVLDLQGVFDVRFVTLSGGNPAIVKNMDVLINLFHQYAFKVAMETQGSVPQPWFGLLDYLILSPKPPSSGMQTNWVQLNNCLQMGVTASPTLKVVVFDKRDLDYAARVHQRYPHIPFFVQVGTRGKGVDCGPQDVPSVEDMLLEYRQVAQWVMEENRFNPGVRVLPQLHLYLYGHGRGV